MFIVVCCLHYLNILNKYLINISTRLIKYPRLSAKALLENKLILHLLNFFLATVTVSFKLCAFNSPFICSCLFFACTEILCVSFATILGLSLYRSPLHYNTRTRHPDVCIQILLASLFCSSERQLIHHGPSTVAIFCSFVIKRRPPATPSPYPWARLLEHTLIRYCDLAYTAPY